MRTNIYATFRQASTAKSAVGALLDHGAAAEDISLVMPKDYQDNDNSATEELDSAEKGITTTTGADAASGAAKGAGIGLGVGVAAALVSILVPGIGLVIGGGALATALAGTAATTAAGAIAGGATGYMKDQGVPHDVADRFTTQVEKGGAILSISVPSGNLDYETAQALFAKYGETDVEVWKAEPARVSTPAY
ncbi:MAG: hypothetical protein H7Y17_07815 [Chlorobia bacterium]|nr:hypothetical protein [Fimbriimonadaceae bacterium]